MLRQRALSGCDSTYLVSNQHVCVNYVAVNQLDVGAIQFDDPLNLLGIGNQPLVVAVLLLLGNGIANAVLEFNELALEN